MYWGLAGTLGTQGPRGVWGESGALGIPTVSVGAILGVRGVRGCRWMSGVYWGAGRDSRYSGTRRGIGACGALGACRDVGVVLGVSGDVRGVRVYLGPAGTPCTQGPEGI